MSDNEFAAGKVVQRLPFYMDVITKAEILSGNCPHWVSELMGNGSIVHDGARLCYVDQNWRYPIFHEITDADYLTFGPNGVSVVSIQQVDALFEPIGRRPSVKRN